MQGKASSLLRIAAPFALAFALVLAFVPSAFAATRNARQSAGLVGPKANYLILGDSLAYGYQPDLDWGHGYAHYFYQDLQTHGTTHIYDASCPGETTVTMVKGGCPYWYLVRNPYYKPQIAGAVDYLHKHAGQVSPVTLDIGANDLLKDINSASCTVSANWASDLATMDANLTGVILPQLVDALTINGQRTGDLLMMNYYDPYQNLCPNSVPYVQQINTHLAADAAQFNATLVDVFSAFGGASTPNPNLCSYVWICSSFKDIHAQRLGYRVIASAFEQTAGY
jgi:lysophospholipase L1-like esterase